MKISIYIRVHIKMILWKFRILNPKSFRVIYRQSLWNVYLETFRDNIIRWKVSYFLRKIQTLWVNNSITLWIKNANFSGYYFYENTKIYGDFQICISVPLNFCLNFFTMYKNSLIRKIRLISKFMTSQPG